MGNPPRTQPDHPRAIDGATLAAAFAAGAAALAREAAAINAINVFPVPDGDTGTNMSLTMRAAADDALAASGDARDVAQAAARGALMGAKGNSGVILSQILAGFADGADGDYDGPALAGALERGRDAAYRVVSKPKEGTILTAISAAASAARDHAGPDTVTVFAAAVDATRAAVARTPELLPVLKEAGVVDSGAQGLYVLLDGMLRSLRGEAPAAHADGLGAIDPAWLAATREAHTHGEASGYCTEFVIESAAIDVDALRDRLRQIGDSVLVVDAPGAARVHVHTQAPDRALDLGRSLGAVSREKVDDMEAQFRALAAVRTAEGVTAVAVGAGKGIEALLRSLGASVVPGGQTMNPSAGDIRRAIKSSGGAGVIVLPNNKNIVMAARQAAEGIPARVHVIETISVPQGVAALIAMNAEASLEDNISAMTAAAQSVRTAEVTLAARATKLHGLAIAQGQPIGIIDGDLAVAEQTVEDAVRACVQRMVESGSDATLVTLYTGEDVDPSSAATLAGELRAAFAIEVEVVDGGQPHYPYLIGLE